MTEQPPRTLDEVGRRFDELFDPDGFAELLVSSELEVLEGPCVLVWQAPESDSPYLHEGPYTFDEAMQCAHEGLAEAQAELPDEPLPTFEIRPLLDYRGKRG